MYIKQVLNSTDKICLIFFIIVFFPIFKKVITYTVQTDVYLILLNLSDRILATKICVRVYTYAMFGKKCFLF